MKIKQNSLLVALVLLISATAHAQGEVVAGQYVIRRAFNGASIQSTSEPELYQTGAVGIRSIVPFNASDTTCADLISSGVAVACEPNFVYTTKAVSNDSRAEELWGLSTIQASSAWGITTGSSNHVVAVIDTGVDYTHPDLAANMWTNAGEVAGNGIDDDRNGFVDDIHGINAAARNGNPFDDNGHGTHVSGTIAGVGNNNFGIIGVAPGVKVMGLKFLGAGGGGTLNDAVVAIRYMIMMKNRGVNVVAANNSWGGAGYSRFLEQAIEEARDAGILFVAAAGNEANHNDAAPTYPANYTTANLLSVAAIDRNGVLASFSNYGSQTVHIAAPGVSILSTTPHAQFSSFSGTSMATPHVSAVAALVASALPGASFQTIKDRLLASSVVSSKLAGKVINGRVLNAFNAVTGAQPSNPGQNPITPPAQNAAKIKSLTVQGSVSSFNLRVRASTETSAQLMLQINGRNCPLIGSFTADRLVSIKGKAPSAVNALTVKVKNDRSLKRKTIRRGQRGVRRSSAMSSSRVREVCNSIFGSLRVR